MLNKDKLFISNISKKLNPYKNFVKVKISQNGKTVKLPVQKINKKQNESSRGRTNICVRALFGPYNNVKQMSKFQFSSSWFI